MWTVDIFGFHYSFVHNSSGINSNYELWLCLLFRCLRGFPISIWIVFLRSSYFLVNQFRLFFLVCCGLPPSTNPAKRVNKTHLLKLICLKVVVTLISMLSRDILTNYLRVYTECPFSREPKGTFELPYVDIYISMLIKL